MSADLSVKAIYSAESHIGTLLRRGGRVEHRGRVLDLRPTNSFNPHMLSIMQGVVNGLYAANREKGTPTAPPPLRISERAKVKAWYDSRMHTITLPRQSWSFEPLVLAHEIAHACVGAGHNQRSSHGPEWRKTYVRIAGALISPDAGLLLADALDVPVHN